MNVAKAQTPFITFIAMHRDEYVCLCVCLSVREDISGTTRAIFAKSSVHVARSPSGMLTIGRIAYRREWGDGSAQRGRSVIYDCLVRFVVDLWVDFVAQLVVQQMRNKLNKWSLGLRLLLQVKFHSVAFCTIAVFANEILCMCVDCVRPAVCHTGHPCQNS